MRLLYLIRHASPDIQPNVPTPEWRLSQRGIDDARRLAEIARPWRLQSIYSSIEPKAESTALIIGDAAGLTVRVTQGFEELRFDQWFDNADEFSRAVRSILTSPDISTRGAERASAAALRFEAGVRIVEDGPFPAAIVSHGRVLTAFLAQLLHVEDPFELWRSISMPGWACVDIEPAVPKLIEAFRGLEEVP